MQSSPHVIGEQHEECVARTRYRFDNASMQRSRAEQRPQRLARPARLEQIYASCAVCLRDDADRLLPRGALFSPSWPPTFFTNSCSIVMWLW